MKELTEMSKEELFEIIRIKDSVIKELRDEVKLYQDLINQFQKEKIKD